MSWRQFKASWHKAQKRKHAQHIKDDPQFYEKRQARWDKSDKMEKCLKKNVSSISHRDACIRKYGVNNNPSTRGTQLK